MKTLEKKKLFTNNKIHLLVELQFQLVMAEEVFY